MYSPFLSLPLCLNVTALPGSCSLASGSWPPGYSFPPAGSASSSKKDQDSVPRPSGDANCRSMAGCIFVPNLGALEISSHMLLYPEVTPVPMSGLVYSFWPCTEKYVVPSSLMAGCGQKGCSGVGAGIFSSKEPIEELLTGTLLPQPLLLSDSMHYVNCLCC